MNTVDSKEILDTTNTEGKYSDEYLAKWHRLLLQSK
jgi:hypothetical protein